MQEIFCGADFALGYKREGNVEFFRALGKEKGFAVTVVAPQAFEGQIMSSSRIRQMIAEGDLDDAARFLGRYPSVRGRVVKGDQRGRTLGFPTANLAIAERRLIPADGIYAVRVKIGETWHGGAANIGIRPTFDHGHRLVEVFVLDFDGDLYGREIFVYFRDRIRDERKFKDVEELVRQIEKDVRFTRDMKLPARKGQGGGEKNPEAAGGSAG